MKKVTTDESLIDEGLPEDLPAPIVDFTNYEEASKSNDKPC